jgi:hypothetical protein
MTWGLIGHTLIAGGILVGLCFLCGFALAMVLQPGSQEIPKRWLCSLLDRFDDWRDRDSRLSRIWKRQQDQQESRINYDSVINWTVMQEQDRARTRRAEGGTAVPHRTAR